MYHATILASINKHVPMNVVKLGCQSERGSRSHMTQVIGHMTQAIGHMTQAVGPVVKVCSTTSVRSSPEFPICR